MAIDESDPSKDVIVVGAPTAKFDRVYTDPQPDTKRAALMVFTDEFTGFKRFSDNTTQVEAIGQTIENRNNYFGVYSNPYFRVDVDVFIFECTKSVLLTIELST